MSTDLGEKNEPPPARGRWQFSLRRMFVATTAIAVLFSRASLDGWVKTDIVIYLSIVVLAGVFSDAAQQCLLRACIVFGVIYMTGVLAYLTRPPVGGVIGGYQGISQRALWLCVLIVFCFAVFLRAKSHVTLWSLAGSLALTELFIATAIFLTLRDCYGCSTLYETLGFRSIDALYQRQADWILRSVFIGRFADQRWYIAAPWLLGIGFGEILARRRESGGGPS